MAFNNNNLPEDEQEFKTSKFNEAYLKLIRVHKLQDSIIQCSFNPTAFNEHLQTRNYDIILQCCNGILKEVWSKLTPDERTNVMVKKIAIETFLENHPIIELKNNQSNSTHKEMINKYHWNIFKRVLFEYDLLMRELLGRCGYDSPDNEDWDDGL